jgi:hypothetical protein
MVTATLDEILTAFDRLDSEDQVLVSELIRKRQIEVWRKKVADQAKRDIRAFRAGKIKAKSAAATIKDLEALLVK